MMTSNKTHYAYKITNLNSIDEQQFYIGVHSDKNPDSLNDGYMGSSKYLDEAMNTQGKENFQKEILSVWETREEAMLEERTQLLYVKNQIAKSFYNKSIPTPNKFATPNQCIVIDKQTNKTKSILVDEYLMNKDIYDTPSTGKVTALNRTTGLIEVITTKEFHNNDHFVRPHTNMVSVINANGEILFIFQEEYCKGDLVSINKNKVVAYDATTGERIQISTDEFNSKPTK